jgi:hypothetical protein
MCAQLHNAVQVSSGRDDSSIASKNSPNFSKAKSMTKTDSPDDLELRIKTAHANSCYARPLLPVRETIQAPCYGATEGAYPYVFLSDLPEKYHDYLNAKAYGSGCPAFREEHRAYWLWDMRRWLEAIGVQLEAKFQVQDPAPFMLPDPTDD